VKVWVAAEIDLSEAGGPQEHLIGRWTEFCKRGHDVTVFAPSPSQEIHRPLNFRFEPLRPMMRPRQIGFQQALFLDWRKRLAHGELPDVIYLRTGQWLFVPAVFAVRRSIPLISEINGNILANLQARNMVPALRTAAVRIEDWICRSSFKVLTVSPDLVDLFLHRSGVSSDCIVLSPCGVDTQQFRPPADADEISHARRHFGLSDGFLIGFVGVFEWWQNLPSVLHAVRALVNRVPGPWKLVLAGYGSQESLLRRLAVDLGIEDRVIFTGRIDPVDVPRLMQTFDIGLLPVRHFAAPVKFMQYAAMGLPTIYPSKPDLSWLGHAGAAYDPDAAADSPDSLAGVLAGLFADVGLRRALGVRSRELALRRFDWSAVVSQMEVILQSAKAGNADVR
jgi:glycosyltransferase involved in cell wall biosynthesis